MTTSTKSSWFESNIAATRTDGGEADRRVRDGRGDQAEEHALPTSDLTQDPNSGDRHGSEHTERTGAGIGAGQRTRAYLLDGRSRSPKR